LPHVRSPTEVLTEIVFGLALSVGALALVGNPPTTPIALYTALATFGFSFLVLILVWIAFPRLTSVLTFESPWTLGLNVVLLLTVTIEPFLFDLIVRPNETSTFLEAANGAFGIDIGVMAGVLGLFAWYLASSKRSSLDPQVRQRLRREGLNRWIVSAIFLVSAAPIFGQLYFFNVQAHTMMWIAGFLVLLGSRLSPTSVRPTRP
jgi:uncharacterized membrane protein